MFRRWIQYTAVVLMLGGCGASTQTQSTNYLTCTATATSTTTSPVPISLYASGGTPPYIVSSVRLGTDIASSTTGTTTFTGSTQISSYFSSTTTNYSTATGAVLITDSSSTPLSGSCAFSLGTTTGTGTTGGGTGGLACQVTMSSNPSTKNNWVSATATITSASNGSGWLDTISFPPSSGISGQYTSATSAGLYFQQSGTFTISMLVKDYSGNWASCSTLQTVY